MKAGRLVHRMVTPEQATILQLAIANHRKAKKLTPEEIEAFPHKNVIVRALGMKDNVVVGAGAKVLGAITVGANTRIGAGSVLLRNVAADSTVVGVPGRVIHQSGARIDPLAHSALPDAEANVIRNLMERIDILESELSRMQACLQEVAAGRPLREPCSGKSQNLRDREILEFLGDRSSNG